MINYILISSMLVVLMVSTNMSPILMIGMLNLYGLIRIRKRFSGIVMIMMFGIPVWLSRKICTGFGDFVPPGCPDLLVVVLFVIEVVSLLVRPFAMVLRISINLICRHLLLRMGGMFNPIFILILELGVALIQAYVFCVLMLI